MEAHVRWFPAGLHWMDEVSRLLHAYDFEKAEEARGGAFSPTNYYNGRFVGGNDLLNTRPEDIPKAIEIYHSYGQSTEMHLNGNASGEAWISGLEKIIAKDKYANIKDTRHTSSTLSSWNASRSSARWDL